MSVSVIMICVTFKYCCLLVGDCGALSHPSNGRVTYSPPDTTTFGARATYSCDTGYTLQGSRTLECQADETWSGSTPTCARKSKNHNIDSVILA